uniref:Uncharacterized protein n=1 Tax=Panagrolaimus davidi TaxID=227884 RepID=A0A914PSS0_9BILA
MILLWDTNIFVLVKKGFFLSPAEFKTKYQNHGVAEDHRFKHVYDLAEKQALQKQKMVSDAESFNIVDCIKADLIEVIPNASFNEMDKKFLMESLGIDWYLCLDTDGVITLKHHSVIDQSDCILAEMKSQNEFFLTPDVKTNLTVSFNNVKPIL